MKKILKIYKFIRGIFSRDGYYFDLEDEEDVKLTKRMAVRITPSEKELIEKFCELKGISISRFLRIAANNEIARFINQHEAYEKYYNSKVG